ncbi:MAG: hypothetical protein ABSH50_33040 [Bryobacteraceae bacterium]|jgi:hypothetical protein
MVIIWGSCLLLLVAAAVVFSILLAKAAQAKRASKTPNCVYCGNGTLRLSTPDHWIDPLLEHWSCVPHRCDVCYRRQYRYTAESPGDGG